MGGVVLFPPLPRLFIPMAKGDFLHPSCGEPPFFLPTNNQPIFNLFILADNE